MFFSFWTCVFHSLSMRLMVWTNSACWHRNCGHRWGQSTRHFRPPIRRCESVIAQQWPINRNIAVAFLPWTSWLPFGGAGDALLFSIHFQGRGRYSWGAFDKKKRLWTLWSFFFSLWTRVQKKIEGILPRKKKDQCLAFWATLLLCPLFFLFINRKKIPAKKNSCHNFINLCYSYWTVSARLIDED